MKIWNPNTLVFFYETNWQDNSKTLGNHPKYLAWINIIKFLTSELALSLDIVLSLLSSFSFALPPKVFESLIRRKSSLLNDWQKTAVWGPQHSLSPHTSEPLPNLAIDRLIEFEISIENSVLQCYVFGRLVCRRCESWSGEGNILLASLSLSATYIPLASEAESRSGLGFDSPPWLLLSQNILMPSPWFITPPQLPTQLTFRINYLTWSHMVHFTSLQRQ